MFMVCILHVLGCGGVLSASERKTVAFGNAWFLEIFVYCTVDITGKGRKRIMAGDSLSCRSNHKENGMVPVCVQKEAACNWCGGASVYLDMEIAL